MMPVLQQYDKQEVELEGFYLSTPHGGYLMGLRCTKHFVTKNYSWPDGVYLTWPGGYLGPRMKNQKVEVPFLADKTTSALLQKAIAQLKAAHPRTGRIRATVAGLLVTGGEDYVVDGSGTSLDGFGGFGRFPAALILQKIKAAEVVFDEEKH